MGIVNGIMTLMLMAIFVAIVVWAWRSERHKDFDAAAKLPLEEDDGAAIGRKKSRNRTGGR